MTTATSKYLAHQFCNTSRLTDGTPARMHSNPVPPSIIRQHRPSSKVLRYREEKKKTRLLPVCRFHATEPPRLYSSTIINLRSSSLMTAQVWPIIWMALISPMMKNKLKLQPIKRSVSHSTRQICRHALRLSSWLTYFIPPRSKGRKCLYWVVNKWMHQKWFQTIKADK